MSQQLSSTRLLIASTGRDGQIPTSKVTTIFPAPTISLHSLRASPASVILRSDHSDLRVQVVDDWSITQCMMIFRSRLLGGAETEAGGGTVTWADPVWGTLGEYCP